MSRNSRLDFDKPSNARYENHKHFWVKISKPHYIQKHLYGIIFDHETKTCSYFFDEISARDVVLETLRYGQKVDFGLKGEIATVTQEKKILLALQNLRTNQAMLYALCKEMYIKMALLTRHKLSLHIQHHPTTPYKVICKEGRLGTDCMCLPHGGFSCDGNHRLCHNQCI